MRVGFIILLIIIGTGCIISKGKPKTEKLILGDWIAESSIEVEEIRFKGFHIINKSAEINWTQWNKEGVMYMKLAKNGSRMYPSSFDYKVNGDSLFMRITFSAANLQVGRMIPWKYYISQDLLYLINGKDTFKLKRK